MKVMVKATKEQLKECGVIYDSTIEWLLNGSPKEVREISEEGVYLKHPEDTLLSHKIVWIRKNLIEETI